MSWFRLFDRNRREQEFDRELQFHIDQVTRDFVEQGMTPEEAHRQALLEFGGKEQAAQSLRDVHVVSMLERARANLKAGFRLIRRAPGFSAAVILTLALGVGANSAVFSAIDAVLLRPLPFPHSEELLLLRQYEPAGKNPNEFVAPVRVHDWSRMSSTLQAVSGYFTEDGSELSGELPEKLTRAFVTPGFLQVMGVSPALGRDFTAEEEKANGPNVLIISNRLWKRRFGGNPNVLGKSLRFGSSSSQIIGVMPASFQFPSADVDAWLVAPFDSPYSQDRASTWYTVVARMKPGVSVQSAQADMVTVQNQLGRQFPKTDAKLAVRLEPLKENTIAGIRRSLWLLFGSVTLLLLIACTNIAALLLARNSDREHEISVRFSLGASRRTVMAQLLTETFVLSLAGTLLGLMVAAASSSVFRALAQDLPRVEEIRLDWRIVGYSLFCALAVTFLCGLLPAWRATRGLAGSLAQHSRTQVAAHNPMQWVLVGVQVALAVTLLFGAGLLLRSFQELGRVSPGFDPNHVLTLHISGSWAETSDMKALEQRVNRLLDTLRAVPGVEAAATTSNLPGVPGDYKAELQFPEGQDDVSRKMVADSRFISPGYFDVLRIPVLEGEGCRYTEGSTGIVVNRSFARQYFSTMPALGHHLVFGATTSYPVTGEIRGIVSDAREQGLHAEPMPTVYWCVSAASPNRYYLLRTRGEPMTMADTIRRTILRVEPSRSVFDLMPLQAHLIDAYSENRLRTILLTMFALTAVSLACIGLYGTLSYFVTLRRREIGLRLALGAVRRQIAGRYLLQGLRVTLLGCVCGLVLAAGAGKLLSGMLYGISSFDAMTFAGVIFLMFVVAGFAALVPAWRASRTDPMQVLREE